MELSAQLISVAISVTLKIAVYIGLFELELHEALSGYQLLITVLGLETAAH